VAGDVRSRIEAQERARGGDVGTLRLNFDRCLALGVDQVVLDLQAAESGNLLPLLDRYAAVLKTSGA
jgi:hypothetical protein